MDHPTVLLQEQVERAEELKRLPKNSPRYKIWCDTTTKILQENFTDEYAAMFNKIWPKVSVTRLQQRRKKHLSS